MLVSQFLLMVFLAVFSRNILLTAFCYRKRNHTNMADHCGQSRSSGNDGKSFSFSLPSLHGLHGPMPPHDRYIGIRKFDTLDSNGGYQRSSPATNTQHLDLQKAPDNEPSSSRSCQLSPVAETPMHPLHYRHKKASLLPPREASTFSNIQSQTRSLVYLWQFDPKRQHGLR